jgi:hypothetical protein
MSNAYIDALLRERKGYSARQLVERVRAIDLELARLGYTPSGSPPPVDDVVVPAPGRANATPAKKTRARKKA